MIWRGWGEGFPVVLLHGGHGSWTHWIRNLDALLAQGYSVWAPDLPAMGESATPPDPWNLDEVVDIVQTGLRQILGEQAYALVGFSLGGLVAGHLAGRYPQNIRKLVLVDAAGMGMSSDKGIAMRSWRNIDDPVQRMEVHRLNVLAFMLAQPESADAFTGTLQMANVEADRRTSNRDVSRSDSLFQALALVQCPIHAIWGEQDALYRAARERLTEALQIRGVRTVRFIAGGHWSQYENPQEFNRELLEILSSLQDLTLSTTSSERRLQHAVFSTTT